MRVGSGDHVAAKSPFTHRAQSQQKNQSLHQLIRNKEHARVDFENMHLLRKIAEIRSSVPSVKDAQSEYKDRVSRLRMISKAKLIASNANLIKSPSSKSIADSFSKKRSISRDSNIRLLSARLVRDPSAQSL